MEYVKAKMNDQDFMQKVNSGVTFTLEMYRVLVSTLLILFVPQKCGDHVCSYSENMNAADNKLYTAGLFFNFLTMCLATIMYSIEFKRENRLITYLEVNKGKPCDNESVGEALTHLSEPRRNNIWKLDKQYQRAAYITMFFFVINTIISGCTVYNYYLDGQTTTTFITNVLFMISKLSDVYATANTEPNVFYSAYLKSKVQYNDVDPDKYDTCHIENNEEHGNQKEDGNNREDSHKDEGITIVEVSEDIRIQEQEQQHNEINEPFSSNQYKILSTSEIEILEQIREPLTRVDTVIDIVGDGEQEQEKDEEEHQEKQDEKQDEKQEDEEQEEQFGVDSMV